MADIVSVLVDFYTTGDDKDTQISFSLSIDGPKLLAHVDGVGAGVLWDNNTTQPPVQMNLSEHLKYDDRLQYHLWIGYYSTDGNPGWEGQVEVIAQTDDGNQYTVLRRTADFKLGESGNPHSVSFPFNN
jgi:hypothetical protein